MKSPFAVAVLAIALAGAVGADPPHAAAQPAGQTFHIELNSLPGCFEKGCDNLFSDFGDKDVTALQQGRQYPVQVARGDKSNFPAHLLVVFGAGAKRPGDTGFAGKLDRPLSRGWLVSVAQKDGSFTPYCNKETLAHALAGTSTEAFSARAAEVGLRSAIETLQGFPGRRVLLFINAGDADLPKWLGDAARALAPIYVVDGGEQKKVHSYMTNWGGEVAPHAGDWRMVTRRMYDGGVMHEVKLSSAMKDLVADSQYDYDLSFSMPASESENPAVPLALRVELTTRHNVTASGYAIAIPNSLRAGLYTVAGQKMGGSTAQARIAIPQDLTVVWRCSFGQYPTVLFRIQGTPSREVLPHAIKPNGTVPVPYSADAGLSTTANKSTAPPAAAAAPQTLRIEAANLLGTEIPH
jgi:hypothetical protein